MIKRHLLLGVLIGIAFVQVAKAACAHVPFACFAQDWETKQNAGFAFDYSSIKEKCPKEADLCKEPCPSTDLRKHIKVVSKENLIADGILFDCNPTDLFCKTPEAKGCIPKRLLRPIILGPSKSSDKIETLILPICRRGDTGDDCNVTKERRFCTEKDIINEADVTANLLPWDKLTDHCIIVEAPAGGGTPNKDMFPVRTVWRFTGFPHKVVTSSFLLKRPEENLKDCKPYEEHPKDCFPLPLCDKNNQPQPCEIQCANWEVPGDKEKPCRVLDMENMPLYRQGSPPFADFMAKDENLTPGKSSTEDEPSKPKSRKRKSTSDSTNKTPSTVHGEAQKSPIRYPRAINIASITGEMSNTIKKYAYWLDKTKNPFYTEYEPKKLAYLAEEFETINPSACTKGDEKVCIGDPKKTGGSKDSEGLAGWIIAVIVVVPVLCCVLLICVGGGVGGYIYMKKRNANATTDADPAALPTDATGAPAEEEAKPLLEGEEPAKSAAVGVSTTGSTAV